MSRKLTKKSRTWLDSSPTSAPLITYAQVNLRREPARVLVTDKRSRDKKPACIPMHEGFAKWHEKHGKEINVRSMAHIGMIRFTTCNDFNAEPRKWSLFKTARELFREHWAAENISKEWKKDVALCQSDDCDEHITFAHLTSMRDELLVILPDKVNADPHLPDAISAVHKLLRSIKSMAGSKRSATDASTAIAPLSRVSEESNKSAADACVDTSADALQHAIKKPAVDVPFRPKKDGMLFKAFFFPSVLIAHIPLSFWIAIVRYCIETIDEMYKRWQTAGSPEVVLEEMPMIQEYFKDYEIIKRIFNQQFERRFTLKLIGGEHPKDSKARCLTFFLHNDAEYSKVDLLKRHTWSKWSTLLNCEIRIWVVVKQRGYYKLHLRTVYGHGRARRMNLLAVCSWYDFMVPIADNPDADDLSTLRQSVKEAVKLAR